MTLSQALFSALLVMLLIGIWLITQYALVPYIRLQRRRSTSRQHSPQPEEIWVQDEGLLYIDAVGPTGVEIMTFDPRTKQLNKWKDTWPEWQKRLEMRTVWFTGERRPLGRG